MHRWGDEWFKKYGGELDTAICDLENRMRKWARVGVCGKEKWGCYTESTEVLTKCGWKSIKDVTLDDEVATLKDGVYLEYNKPSDVMRYEYDGKMYRLVNRGVDILVTPNHKLYVAKGSYFKNGEKRKHPFELTIPDTYFRQDKRFKKDVVWVGTPADDFFVIPSVKTECMVNRKGKSHKRIVTHDAVKVGMNELLKFLGFYVAEGYVCGNGRVNIAHNPYTESELAESLIRNMGFEPHSTIAGNAKFFNNVPFLRWIEENCGRGAENKQVPPFIKELDSDSIRVFLEYLYIGDGHKAETSNTLTTVSKKLCDDVCELILKCGSTFRVRVRDRRQRTSALKNGRIIKQNFVTYNINWMKNKEVEIEMSKVNKGLIENYAEEWVDYKGEVYCCTVPNHIMYVRKDGKGYWCGNSYQDEYFRMWDGGLYEIFFGYRCCRYGWFENFLWHIDHMLIPVSKTRFGWRYVGLSDFNTFIHLKQLVWKWQARMVNKAFQVTCAEHPDIVDELVSDVDCYPMIKPCKWGNVDGEAIHNKYWKRV